MSTEYSNGADVPRDILVERLNEISRLITEGKDPSMAMSVPAEVDYDMDLVLAEAARRLYALRLILHDNMEELGLTFVQIAAIMALSDQSDLIYELERLGDLEDATK